MRIYVVQYNCSMSPIGEVVSVKSSLAKAKKGAQESEDVREFPYLNGHDGKPETLIWSLDGNHGPWSAEGYGGVYIISEWEVSPP